MKSAGLDAEERQLIDELIAHDQSLTEEERRIERWQERVSRLKISLQRLSKALDTDVPSPILANEAMNIFRRSWALWEQDMQRVFGGWMADKFRKETARCVACGADLPLPYSDEDMCPKCIAHCEQLAADD